MPGGAPARIPRRADGADHFRLMADFAPVMIWLAAPDRKCVYFNRPWLAFTGRTVEDEAGTGWAEGIHPEDRDRCLAERSRAFEERRPFELEYRLRRADGEYRWLLDKGVPLIEEGRLAGFVGSALDVTDRLLAEREARTREDQKLARERNARANAESETLARDQFLAIVSHELRSPLNGVKSWAHVLENHLREADETVRRAVAGIMIGVEHQVRLIDDLLDVTRAMSGNLGLAKQAMALLPVLAEAIESLRGTALEKGVAVTTDYRLQECEIHGDPDRVRQVFVNLVSNAIKFTPSGGTIRVTADSEGAMARVAVSDDGAGISPEFLPYVFDPFRQDERSPASRRGDGLGLGLALVRRLAEMHGGYVTCESEGLGRGATFRVYLPLRRESAARVIIGRDLREAHAELPSLAGIHVLLIDDQREARESLAALLRQAGAAVFVAASGKEALAQLEGGAAGEDDVIICDIAMPGEDGYATLKRIRAWEAAHSRPRRPAIALSAFTQREDRMRALTEGFQMHLTKPVAPAELAVVVASVARGLRV